MQGPGVMEESASPRLITAVSRPNEVTAGPHHIDWIRHLPFSLHTGDRSRIPTVLEALLGL